MLRGMLMGRSSIACCPSAVSEDQTRHPTTHGNGKGRGGTERSRSPFEVLDLVRGIEDLEKSSVSCANKHEKTGAFSPQVFPSVEKGQEALSRY